MHLTSHRGTRVIKLTKRERLTLSAAQSLCRELSEVGPVVIREGAIDVCDGVTAILAALCEKGEERPNEVK